MYKSGEASHVCIPVIQYMHFRFLKQEPILVFWEQQGLQTFGHRIQITRPNASQPAFERHCVQLMEEYGSIHAINLLGTKENEALLTNSYARHLQVARSVLGDNLGLTSFDFHSAVRIGGHEGVIRNLP